MEAPAPIEDQLWKALADPSRRRLLDLLRQRPHTTGELAEQFSVSRYAVMKHLSVLVEAGLVLVRRQGRLRWNHLNPVPIQQLYRRWIRPFEAPPADALLRLKALAEGTADERQPLTSTGDPDMTTATAAPSRTLDSTFEIKIAAPAARSWHALTDGIADWWPADFYTGAEPRRFVIEGSVGGRMYEDWGDGDGLLWGTVIGLRREQYLHIAGELSPEFGGPGRALMRFDLDTGDDGTTVRFRLTLFGHLGDQVGTQQEEGWRYLLDSLKKHLESSGDA